MTHRYAGVRQIEAEWVHQHRVRLLIIDVQERHEVGVSDLGLIYGARFVPLSELRERALGLPTSSDVLDP